MLPPVGEGQTAMTRLTHEIQNNSSFVILSTIRKPLSERYIIEETDDVIYLFIYVVQLPTNAQLF